MRFFRLMAPSCQGLPIATITAINMRHSAQEMTDSCV
jgi:hypothetical protein